MSKKRHTERVQNRKRAKKKKPRLDSSKIKSKHIIHLYSIDNSIFFLLAIAAFCYLTSDAWI